MTHIRVGAERHDLADAALDVEDVSTITVVTATNSSTGRRRNQALVSLYPKVSSTTIFIE